MKNVTLDGMRGAYLGDAAGGGGTGTHAVVIMSSISTAGAIMADEPATSAREAAIFIMTAVSGNGNRDAQIHPSAL